MRSLHGLLSFGLSSPYCHCGPLPSNPPPLPARPDPLWVGAPHPPLLRGSPCAPGQSQTTLYPPNPGEPRLLSSRGGRSPALHPPAERCGRTTREGEARHHPPPLPLWAGVRLPAARPTFRARPEGRAPRRRPTPSPPCFAGGAVWASPRGRGPGAGECSRTPFRVARAGERGWRGSVLGGARSPPLPNAGLPNLYRRLRALQSPCYRQEDSVTENFRSVVYGTAPLLEFFFREVFITVPPCISPREAPPVPFSYVSAPTSHAPSPRERVGEDSHFRLSLRE